jgi:hypothetical protein
MRRISSEVMEGCKNFTDDGQFGGLGSRSSAPPTAGADASPFILLLGVMSLSDESANAKENEHVIVNNKYGVMFSRSHSFLSLRFGSTWHLGSCGGDCGEQGASTRWNRWNRYRIGYIQMEVTLHTNYNIFIHVGIIHCIDLRS